jgi:hypothetical protein
MELKNLLRSRMGCQSNRHLPLQVSDIWHKIKGHIGPNLAFFYGGHDLGRRATKKKKKKIFVPTAFKTVHFYNAIATMLA